MLQALLLPPCNYDDFVYHLARVIMFVREGSLFLQNYNSYRQVYFPVGFDILPFMFLRFYSDWFTGIFSFLSYTTIITSTFSLVKKAYKDVKLSLLTAMIIASLSGIVVRTTSFDSDIPLVSMATICFLSAYNLIKFCDLFSGLILITSLILGISIKANFMGFAIPFCIIFLISYFKELLRLIIKINTTNKKYLLFLIIPILLLSCLAFFTLNNYLTKGNLFGPDWAVKQAMNRDGLKGAILNGVRYTIQTLNLPSQFGGRFIDELHNRLLGEFKYLGRAKFRDTDIKLTYTYPLAGFASWYGPLALLLILPAILYSVFDVNKFLRLVSLSLISYYLAFCYKVGWMPWNSRFLSLFYGASGICVASFIKKYLGDKQKFILLIISFITLTHAAFLNGTKPLINLNYIGKYCKKDFIKLPYHWFYYVINRDGYYYLQYQDDRVGIFSKIRKNSRVMVVADDEVWIYPFIINRPDLSIIVTNLDNFVIHNKIIDINNNEDVALLLKEFDYFLIINKDIMRYFDYNRIIYKRDGVINEKGVYLVDSFFLFDYK
jgi:hypothetical protein